MQQMNIGPNEGKKKMHKSPCETCLVFPACKEVCDKKSKFTAERFCRLLKYMKLDANEGTNHPLIKLLMNDIWDENTTISLRNQGYDGDPTNYWTQRKKILHEIATQTSYHNTKFCHSLMKEYNIERKDYADKV